MKNKNIAILLGGNYLNQGVYDKFKDLDLFVIVIDWNEDPFIKGDFHLKIDVKDHKSVISELKKLNIKNKNFKIAYTSMDLAVFSLNKINQLYNKKYLEDENIISISTKENMREKWQKSNLFNRKSFTREDTKDIQEILQVIPTNKVLFKPSVACSSRGLSVINKTDIKKTSEAFEYAKSFSLDSKVMIEEYILGTEYTIEMLGDNYGNVSVYGISKKYHSKNAGINKISVKLHYNAQDVPDNKAEKIAQFGIDCYKSLGIKNSFGHLEIMEKEDGTLVPIEIGARSSGYIASHLIDEVSGKGFLQDYINVINGGRVFNGLLKQTNRSSMYFFYDLTPNRKSNNVSNLMKFLPTSIKSLYHQRENLIENREFKIITNDIERYGYEILVGDKDMLTIENIESAEDAFLNDFFGT